MSTDHVDCNVVKLQQQSGRSDAEIASAIGGSEADVAKCHGPEHTGNKDSTPARSRRQLEQLIASPDRANKPCLALRNATGALA